MVEGDRSRSSHYMGSSANKKRKEGEAFSLRPLPEGYTNMSMYLPLTRIQSEDHT